MQTDSVASEASEHRIVLSGHFKVSGFTFTVSRKVGPPRLPQSFIPAIIVILRGAAPILNYPLQSSPFFKTLILLSLSF